MSLKEDFFENPAKIEIFRASEMSEQLDMMGEFCYGPDAFKNSGISHSYVRVSKEKPIRRIT